MAQKIKFTRIGGLSPVVQKGYTTNPKIRGYHTPPARKGFYAFIYPYFEPFLLGGNWSKLGKKNKHEKFEYLKDNDGNKIKLYVKDFQYSNDTPDIFSGELNPELKKYLVKGKCGKSNRNYDGTDISDKFWTEDCRDCNDNFVNYYLIYRKPPKVFEYTGELWHHLKNSAVKPFEIISEVGDWIKTDYDVFVRALAQDKMDCVKQLRSGPFGQIEINTRNVYKHISKDHLEVFIERIK